MPEKIQVRRRLYSDAVRLMDDRAREIVSRRAGIPTKDPIIWKESQSRRRTGLDTVIVQV